jgi:hypothetical protein
MKTLHKRCSGLDIHSETIVACVLLDKSETDIVKEIETFPTLTKDLFRLLKWVEEKRSNPNSKRQDNEPCCLVFYYFTVP